MTTSEGQTWKAEPCRKHEWERRFRGADDQPGLTAGVVAVAFALASWANGDGRSARPGTDLLMTASRLEKRSVQAHLSWLRAHGWVILTEPGTSGRGRTARKAAYRLSYPAEVTS